MDSQFRGKCWPTYLHAVHTNMMCIWLSAVVFFFFIRFCRVRCCCCLCRALLSWLHWEKSISLENVGLNVLDVDRGHSILSIRVCVCVRVCEIIMHRSSTGDRCSSSTTSGMTLGPPALCIDFFCCPFPYRGALSHDYAVPWNRRCRANTAMKTDVPANGTLSLDMRKCHARNEFIRFIIFISYYNDFDRIESNENNKLINLLMSSLILRLHLRTKDWKIRPIVRYQLSTNQMSSETHDECTRETDPAA